VLAPLFYTGLGLSLAMVLMGFLIMVLGFERQNWAERTHGFGYLVRVLSILWGLICCLTVAFLSASAVVRERQQGTLEALLTLPLSRREILWTKCLGCLFRPWIWWLCFAAVVVLGTAVTALHVSGGFFLLAGVVVHGAFFASLGIFLSVTSKKVLSAHGKLVLALVLIFFGSWLLTEITRLDAGNVYGEFLRVGLNPVLTWWTLGFSYRDFQATPAIDKELAGALLGLAFYALLALFFWLLACWRFGREKNWRME
jgi:ABC-type transport system involved in multi-copper enzyme maturation permease subunit